MHLWCQSLAVNLEGMFSLKVCLMRSINSKEENRTSKVHAPNLLLWGGMEKVILCLLGVFLGWCGTFTTKTFATYFANEPLAHMCFANATWTNVTLAKIDSANVTLASGTLGWWAVELLGWWARENKLGRNWLRGSSASRQAPLALVNNLLFSGKSQHLYCPNFSLLHCRTLLDHKFRKFSPECNQVWIIDQDELETMRGPHWPAE